MLLTRASQYAISGVLRLAALRKGGYCRIQDLVAGTDAPRHAVAKVFHELGRRGVLESVRGVGGGFRLAAGAEQLTLLQIVESVEGKRLASADEARGLCLPAQSCPLRNLLRPLHDELERILRTTRVGELLASSTPVGRECCLSASCGEQTVGADERRKPAQSHSGDEP